MAGIDVSELLSDPDFVDPVTLIRRMADVNNKGRSVLTEAEPVQVSMVVQGPQAEDFKRFPELVEMHGVRAVWFAGKFNMGEEGTYTDVIRWPAVTGPRYQIHKIDEEYSNFGAGFVKAFMVLS